MGSRVESLSLSALPAAWRAEATSMRDRYGNEQLAKICEAHAADLEKVLANADELLLTPAQAGADPEVLWGADHIAAQVRRGKIANRGRKNAPLVRRGDLPKKPRPASEPSETADESPALDDFSRRALARQVQ